MKVRKRTRRYIVTTASLVGFLGVVLLAPLLNAPHHLPVSSEAGFVSLSPRGASGGAIVPASCESGYTTDADSPGGANGCASSELSFWADSASLSYGGSTTLHWKVYIAPNPENGTSASWIYGQQPTATVKSCVASGAWSGDKTSLMYYLRMGWTDGTNTTYAQQGDSGSGTLASTQTFNITCTLQYVDGTQGTAMKSVTITVAPAQTQTQTQPSTTLPPTVQIQFQ